MDDVVVTTQAGDAIEARVSRVLDAKLVCVLEELARLRAAVELSVTRNAVVESLAQRVLSQAALLERRAEKETPS